MVTRIAVIRGIHLTSWVNLSPPSLNSSSGGGISSRRIIIVVIVIVAVTVIHPLCTVVQVATLYNGNILW